MPSPVETCSFCLTERDLSAAPPRERVYVSDSWRIIVHASALPGWTLLVPRRHIESLDELREVEAEELGRLLRDVSRLYVKELGALKSYVMQFAEGTPHAHFSLVPRMPDLPEDRLGAQSLAFNTGAQKIEASERDALAIRLARAWPSTTPAAVLATDG